MANVIRGAGPRTRSKTSFMPPRLAAGLRRRAVQAAGLALLLLGLAVVVALLSFNAADPSFNRAAPGPAGNFLGLPGAYLADLLLQTIGLGAALFALVPAVWGWRLASGREVSPWWLRLAMVPFAILAGAIALAAIPAPEAWPLRAGLGGFAGTLLQTGIGDLIALAGIKAEPWMIGTGAAAVFIAALTPALAMRWRGWITGSMVASRLSYRGARAILRPIFNPRERGARRPAKSRARKKAPRIEPSLSGAEAAQRRVIPGPKVEPRARPERPASPAPRQPALNLGGGGDYQLPDLGLLKLAPVGGAGALDEAALSHNAKLLESVLEDYGIGGHIAKVRPGPVITLYEFEPAPGIKSSRIVNLSDDIARSMSAVSVRVAVIPGRNVLGIELPNANRETVYLRELLASETYESSTAELSLVLGKDIGGGPVIVDLARMPHLLIAGTTGSGKSVAINTLILSLLYRLPPERCKFIMIDPKMLELSVYEGIPQLLTPVVTDARKAVTALKWAVREMEDRYQEMSKLGVRNIQGFNARIADALAKGKRLKRRVQTGFDDESGQPLYEEEEIELTELPYIVVVVDEMADLMLVAGKDIEMAVQRLAQMARAAGIHLIMATQRPSVDVITGTIKANFPTRISFQVTSKIDSRTILGEQGAEQLLGQGDMLYMAGGGRLARVHGPFVSDREVEDVVRHLKTQGQPNYLAAVTEAEDITLFPDLAGGGAGGDVLYQQAVDLVLREGKASTSFIQRHLQIGYNRAARLIEQMEKEEIVTPANNAGKREVLGIGG
ncbi:MAG: DNA translocase FtsK 4TM domain-containing protein [Alphaproteobacteria bacterium]